MTLHGDPGTAGGYTHFFVVVTRTAAGCKSIPQPEMILGRNSVSDIGETGGTLIGGNYQVGIFVVLAHDVPRPDNAILGAIVRDIQQSPDIELIAGYALLLNFIPGHIGLQLTRDKTALGSHWHDNRVLDLLCLHQAQDLCAEILRPIRPA